MLYVLESLKKEVAMSMQEQDCMDSDFKQLLESRDALISSMKDDTFSGEDMKDFTDKDYLEMI